MCIGAGVCVCEEKVGMYVCRLMSVFVLSYVYVMFMSCRYHEAALQCVTCPLAHAMLLQLLKQTPDPDWLNVCESACPDLHLVLLSLESCAEKYNWTSASDSTCSSVKLNIS